MTLQEDYCRYDLDLSPGQFVKISISDTGYGMTHDVLTHACEPLFTTKEVGQCTGPGLSLVYGFVKQSGGHVRIHSEPGFGTVVSIYLPRLISVDGQSKEDHEEILATARKVRQSWFSKTTTMSGLTLRCFPRIALQRAECSGSSRLISMQHNQNISLLLSDVVMPGVDGVAISKRAREIRHGLPVMLMTGAPRSTVFIKGWRITSGSCKSL